MKGYPKLVATKQDYENLLTMPEFKNRALADLKKIVDAKDETVTQIKAGAAAEPNAKDILIIDNPSPVWKQKGFASLDEVNSIIKTEKKII